MCCTSLFEALFNGGFPWKVPSPVSGQTSAPVPKRFRRCALRCRPAIHDCFSEVFHDKAQATATRRPSPRGSAAKSDGCPRPILGVLKPPHAIDEIAARRFDEEVVVVAQAGFSALVSAKVPFATA